MTLRLSVAALAVSLTLAALRAADDRARRRPPCSSRETMLDGTLAAPAGTYETACHRAYRPGRAGVATPQRGRVGTRRTSR